MGATNDDILKELQDLKLMLTGNGQPEQGVVFRTCILEKEVQEIKENVDVLADHPYMPKKEKKDEPKRWLDPKTRQIILSYFWKAALLAVLGKEAVTF